MAAQQRRCFHLLLTVLALTCVSPRLHAQEEGADAQKEHAHRYLALLEQAYAERTGERSAEWEKRVEEEHDDVEMALAWTLDYGEADPALRFASLLGYFWAGSHLHEARDAMERALKKPGADVPTPVRAQALYRAGVLAFRQGDTRAARTRTEESLEVARRLGDKSAMALALTGLARVALREDPKTVAAYADEAISLYGQLGDRRGEGGPLHMRAEAARMLGDNERAEAMYEESLALHRELKDLYTVSAELHNLAYIKLRQGQTERAEELFRESWIISREIGDEVNDPYILAGLAAVAAAEGRAERAAQLFGASKAMFDALSVVPDPADQAEIGLYAERAQSHLGTEAYAAAYERGRSMGREQAISLAEQS